MCFTIPRNVRVTTSLASREPRWADSEDLAEADSPWTTSSLCLAMYSADVADSAVLVDLPEVVAASASTEEVTCA